MRQVRHIYSKNMRHWVGDGFWVEPLFSHMGADKGTNPFLMLDYAAPYDFKPNRNRPRGVGQHPHKGFETVTIAYQGEVAHRDSTGGGGIIRAGDVQWMTAGNGIIHEEFHSDEFSQNGGLFEMVQLWVNLPAKDKSAPARYQHLSKDHIPVVALANDAGSVRVIAGTYEHTAGAADTFTELNVWDVALKAGKHASVRVPANHSLSMVVLRGEAVFNGSDTAKAGQLVGFVDGDGEVSIQANGDEDVKILLLSGIPIDEPVVGYGPFVMNSEDEIRAAIDDFNSGRFGRIPA
ncbi:pirin family protein [Vitreoscilla massiliensis]|uniref:Pirin family protein n=1 Tax=Vitreoscilla massiliensis TaxID=1689272 RepID=A0ABY4E5W9_9NEIS|nr:pirin family protein [Vitreoscilla massiliensis]UOO91171.1 pirin family protein [Vitreoscilla massiliensis]